MNVLQEKDGLYCHRYCPSPKAKKSLLIELPHGATSTDDFRWYQSRLQGAYPADLIEFFYVNTDVGSPELAIALAEQLAGDCEVHILQSRIPRTFIDCNRVVAENLNYKEGGVTPATAPYVLAPEDIAFLQSMYQEYQQYVRALYAKICGVQKGLALMLHTYAPRTVPISSIDWDIVQQLRSFYDTDRIFDCALRPEIDIIHRTPEEELLCDQAWRLRLMEAYRESGREVADGLSYPLHPVTMAYQHAKCYPRQTLCIEIRRDLLVQEWSPFSEMQIDPEKAERLADPLAGSIRES